MLEEVETVRCNTGGVLQDVCDGECVKTHLFSGSTNDHLLLSFYYDELEVANPLGSRRGKHKLGKLLNWSFVALLHLIFSLFSISNVLLGVVEYPSSTLIFIQVNSAIGSGEV